MGKPHPRSARKGVGGEDGREPPGVTHEGTRLAALARRLGVPGGALDEEVHALAQELTLTERNAVGGPGGQEDLLAGSERRAADVNNGGLDAQLAFLLEHNPRGRSRRSSGPPRGGTAGGPPTNRGPGRNRS
jgi:hypothetical protein